MDATNAMSHASCSRVSHVLGTDGAVAALTIAMEIVAKANGSPTMCPKLNLPPRRWSIMLCFCSDGEWSEP